MLRVSHVGRHTVRPPRVRTPTFPLMPAAYTSALSVQVLDVESFGPLIQRGCLLCGFCSSGQRFVSGFLQIPPRDGHPCLQLTVPPAGPVEDLACSAHAAPPGVSPCRAQQKKTGTLPAGSVPVNESSLVGANCYAASPFDGPVLRANWYLDLRLLDTLFSPSRHVIVRVEGASPSALLLQASGSLRPSWAPSSPPPLPVLRCRWCAQGMSDSG